jgi:hypothetical protein
MFLYYFMLQEGLLPNTFICQDKNIDILEGNYCTIWSFSFSRGWQ